MTWTTSVADLRTLLSDGPTDKLRFRKAIVGEIDGANKFFKTFEFRRIEDFTNVALAAPFGVYKKTRATGAVVRLTSVDFTSDDPDTGVFELVAAPAIGTSLEATHHVQWYTDAEITEFIGQACQWLLSVDSPLNIPDGLQPCVLQYGAHLAYQKMAIRWRERHSDVFRMEDAPKNENAQSPTQEFLMMAKHFGDQATKLRNTYYERQGQNLQPLHGTIAGSVRDQTPQG